MVGGGPGSGVGGPSGGFANRSRRSEALHLVMNTLKVDGLTRALTRQLRNRTFS